MKTLRFLGVMVLVILAGRPDRANAQVITTVIHRFNGNSDGGYPFGQVIRDSFGNLYGTTSTGGTNICFDGPCSSDFGTVFQINSAGAFTTLHRFSGQDGQNAYTGLVQGQDGNFYGTTFSGGTHNSGTVFQITSSGALTKLHDFADTPEGANPRDRLYQDTDGNFYGTTVHGGTNGMGTVFQMSSVGTVTTLYQFSGPDGAYPFKELVALQGVPGIFYGTTQNGGTNNNCLGGCGTVFQITSAGTLTTLHQFGNPDDSTDGANPVCELVQGSDTNLYGTTQYGGTNGAGTVFRISPTGTLTTLYQFNGVTDGYRPFAGLALGSDGNFYGTTVNGPSAGSGSVFQLTPDGSLTTLYAFGGGADGAGPIARLIQGSDGYFYGTTQEGGGSANCIGGCGTVFVVNLNPGMIAVSPITGLGSSGVVSGPFTPASQVYTITNTGTLSLNWSASNGQNWVSLSATNGSLPGNESTNVTVTINGAANALGAGSYSDTVAFNNDTNGNGTTYRAVGLTVLGTHIISIQSSGNDIILNISTLANEWYCVEFTDDLVTGTWGVLAGNVQGTGDIMQFVDAGRAILSQGFYRLRLAPSVDDACGGICPTFIQPPPGSTFINPLKTAFTQTATGLYGKIVVPVANALLRSDIPIYGVAGGRNFRKFRVEYGPGRNPTEWHPLASADKPQSSCPEFKDISWMQGDLDLRGNLATWNTGLKNWEHLPWHPADDPTDFNGVYTIRLVVEGQDGKTVEDRVTCEVGRAIAQCLPGIAISPDKRAVMRFPEQSLMHPFRVYTILPVSSVGEETPPVPAGTEYLGPVYRIREPGDKFIKDVVLEFTPASTELEKRQLDRIGVGQYDTEARKWVWLNTTRTTDGMKFRTVLTELPAPKAIYALLVDATKPRSMVTNEAGAAVAGITPVSASVLVENTFQHDLGTFKSRDRVVGVSLSQAKRNDKDSSFCIQLRNDYSGGNSSCTVLDQSFDVRQYPVMSFDYRVGPDFNTDFFLKVNGRWYDLQFTGDATDYHDRDVNIGNLGRIEGVVADGQWHSVTVDLERMLRQKTGHTRIEEIALADWKVGGYMKLEFGQNPQGAMLWLDNFKILNPHPGTELAAAPPVLWIDRFESDRAQNDLGQNSGVFSSSGPSRCVVKRVSDGNPNAQALQVDYEVPVPGAYGGYWTLLGDLDGRNYRALRLDLKCDAGRLPPTALISLADTRGGEGKLRLDRYLRTTSTDGWSSVNIPLVAFAGSVDLEHLKALALGFENSAVLNRGRVYVDNIRLEAGTPSRLLVDDFEVNIKRGDHAGAVGIHEFENLLNQRTYEFANGAAAIRMDIDQNRQMDDGGRSLILSYGGSIGLDLKEAGFSFSGWHTGLAGINVSPYTSIKLRVRGNKGGETPRVYLSDGTRRKGVALATYTTVGTDWKEAKIPLADFADKGIDLTHLEGLEVIFEWAAMSGTIWLDDIAFE